MQASANPDYRVKIMGITVSIKLDNLNRIAKNIDNIDNILIKAAGKLQTIILKRWENGIGANNKTLQKPAISTGYKKYKGDKTGRGYIDMILTGKMTQSFQPIKENGHSVKLTFANFEMGKARGNYELRPQMMTLDKATKEDIKDYCNKEIMK
jgi:hypothetical protein